jgi:hypothetical protein
MSTIPAQLQQEPRTYMYLYVLGRPWFFLRRMRTLCSNVLVEDIDNYTRIQTLSCLTASESVGNYSSDACGTHWDTDAGSHQNRYNQPTAKGQVLR